MNRSSTIVSRLTVERSARVAGWDLSKDLSKVVRSGVGASDEGSMKEDKLSRAEYVRASLQGGQDIFVFSFSASVMDHHHVTVR